MNRGHMSTLIMRQDGVPVSNKTFALNIRSWKIPCNKAGGKTIFFPHCLSV